MEEKKGGDQLRVIIVENEDEGSREVGLKRKCIFHLHENFENFVSEKIFNKKSSKHFNFSKKIARKLPESFCFRKNFAKNCRTHLPIISGEKTFGKTKSFSNIFA
jgi:hypothetical protein